MVGEIKHIRKKRNKETAFEEKENI